MRSSLKFGNVAEGIPPGVGPCGAGSWGGWVGGDLVFRRRRERERKMYLRVFAVNSLQSGMFTTRYRYNIIYIHIPMTIALVIVVTTCPAALSGAIVTPADIRF